MSPFLEPIVFCVQLALDGVVFAGSGLRDKIDADITAIDSLLLRPFGIYPDLGV